MTMNYTPKLFVDSNIFIETFKKAGLKEASELWEFILSNFDKLDFTINLIVKNEITYHLFFKRNLITLEEVENLLNSFTSMEINLKIEDMMFSFIEKYNIKPNDALILSTCKFYNIKYLISMDKDFTEVCQKENIILINSVQIANSIFK